MSWSPAVRQDTTWSLWMVVERSPQRCRHSHAIRTQSWPHSLEREKKSLVPLFHCPPISKHMPGWGFGRVFSMWNGDSRLLRARENVYIINTRMYNVCFEVSVCCWTQLNKVLGHAWRLGVASSSCRPWHGGIWRLRLQEPRLSFAWEGSPFHYICSKISESLFWKTPKPSLGSTIVNSNTDRYLVFNFASHSWKNSLWIM